MFRVSKGKVHDGLEIAGLGATVVAFAGVGYGDHMAGRGAGIERIGKDQLSTNAGLEVIQERVNPRVKDEAPNRGLSRRRIFDPGLLHHADDAAGGSAWANNPVFGDLFVSDLDRAEDGFAGGLVGVDEAANSVAAQENIVRQEESDRGVAHDGKGAAHGVSGAQRPRLAQEDAGDVRRDDASHGIQDLILAGILEGTLELGVGVEVILDGALRSTGDEDQLGDACVDGLFDSILDRRFVDDRQKLFRDRLGCRQKPGSEAGDEEDGLGDRGIAHAFSLLEIRGSVEEVGSSDPPEKRRGYPRPQSNCPSRFSQRASFPMSLENASSQEGKSMKYLVVSQRGSGLVEYGILAGLVSAIAIVAVLATGRSVDESFDEIGMALSENRAGTGVGTGGQTADEPPQAPADPYAGYYDPDTFLIGTDGVDALDISSGSHPGIMALAGNDTLDGGGPGGIFIGAKGNDTIYTSSGDDTIVFAAGDGVDYIRTGGGNDALVFPDLNASDATFVAVNNDDLRITWASGDSVEVDEMFWTRGQGFETISFLDRDFTYEQALERTQEDSKSTGTVRATRQPDVFVHRASIDPDYMISGNPSGADSLTFVESNFADVTIIRTNSDDLIFTDGSNLYLDEYLWQDGWLETIAFADGARTKSEIWNKSINDSKATGFVYGSRHADDFTHVATVDGSYEIRGNTSGIDSLTFTQTNFSDALITRRNPDDIIIHVQGDQVAIDEYLWQDGSLENIAFMDGPVDKATIWTRSLHDSKSTGSVDMSRYADSFTHANGDGNYTVRGNKDGADELVFTDQSFATATILRDGDTLQITTDAGDVVRIYDYFWSAGWVETITFTDGTKSVADFQARHDAGG